MVTSDPAAPAALNGASSLSDSLQKTARHGTARHGHPPAGIRIEACWDSGQSSPFSARARERERESERPRHQHQHTLFFPPEDRTGGQSAPTVLRVYARSFVSPVWITMMQSAAVLPTESPVKSLPEILGVPLQRKTILHAFVTFLGYRSGGGGGRKRLPRATRVAGFITGNLSVSGGHVRASDVSCCLYSSMRVSDNIHYWP